MENKLDTASILKGCMCLESHHQVEALYICMESNYLAHRCNNHSFSRMALETSGGFMSTGTTNSLHVLSPGVDKGGER